MKQLLNSPVNQLEERLLVHLENVYPMYDIRALAQQLINTFNLHKVCKDPLRHHNNWAETDILTITYGDTIRDPAERPLRTLHNFLNTWLADTVNWVHILPFYPYSSDDGFSVINYKQVNEDLGDWDDIRAIADDYKLMADLVINHCSSRSEWFEQFRRNELPGKDFFIEADPLDDHSAVVRPRTTPLLREVETLDGTRYVWCTFSPDQVDLNFANPAVLLEMADIIRFYMEAGISVFRLDAVAFLWKEPGTNCLNLFQTHEIIRILRALIEHCNPHAIIITETNIPNRENLAYFGNANEAHIIYNFSLPPLLVHALVSGENRYLNNWLMSMPPAQDGTTYLNFIASHDGIGLRPVEGILSEEERDQLISTMRSFGGLVSWREAGGQRQPYEINISLFDAFAGTTEGRDSYQFERFICAHIIMLGLEGVPAFYIHSLLGTENDLRKVELSGNNRAINRHIWDKSVLTDKLRDPVSHHHLVLHRLKKIVRLRKQQAAFHPNSTQYTLHLGEGIFAFWRQNRTRSQSIFCIHNLTASEVALPLNSLNLVETQEWFDIFSGETVADFAAQKTLAPYQCLWLSNRDFSDAQ
ncbi:MAG: hypothetical protein KDI36_13665 [Pseudomonadales bacterium]|nr:hypothetical protein [Pseudomonadales bacterium]